VRRRAVPALLLLVAACTGGDPTVAAVPDGTIAPATTAPPTTTTTLPANTTSTTTTLPPTTTTTAPPGPVLQQTGFREYGVAGPLTLFHPADLVYRIAFHESNNDGAQRQEPLPTAAGPVVLDSRERGTDRQSAADIVVDPETDIRAPVTGTVLRGGTYTLYCDYTDEFVVIEPDERPGWEVKVLHMVGLQVRRGDRVTAGQTVIAQHAHLLPFPSQVDELNPGGVTIPHVHVEVVDPTIPDRPGEPCP
jgi:biotin carboxyl carrier protein